MFIGDLSISYNLFYFIRSLIIHHTTIYFIYLLLRNHGTMVKEEVIIFIAWIVGSNSVCFWKNIMFAPMRYIHCSPIFNIQFMCFNSMHNLLFDYRFQLRLIYWQAKQLRYQYKISVWIFIFICWHWFIYLPIFWYFSKLLKCCMYKIRLVNEIKIK